ncbi:hypothetical protein G7K_5960-t1 [Saitoella complicata NRRL Y-17804]|uniref:Uncharacterized protein n=1 Tax=Saitoella complicata (strain BCRC 22490 / CBS 7301 / JCM 7358 / NBRC 10748 / NRRL Y-17804) TaxID=698492 RepID=A0A0E9NPW8_SAICN|nr:hypothetical protein G7K_5960-t1 [Saitoella complicata NRRL Y-17804]
MMFDRESFARVRIRNTGRSGQAFNNGAIDETVPPPSKQQPPPYSAAFPDDTTPTIPDLKPLDPSSIRTRTVALREEINHYVSTIVYSQLKLNRN